MTMRTLILIGGPTASGKSALALELARRRNGVVINADAMQVYRGLPLLTAQPAPEEKVAIPHELYEVFDPAVASSVGKWKTLAEDAIQRCVAAGRTPVLVGGSGLYFKALLDGLAEIPAIPQAAREEAQALYDKLGSEAFRALLAQRDAASAARIPPNDRQRLIRAYEVVAHTGKPLGAWHRAAAPSASRNDEECFVAGKSFTVERHFLAPPRDQLYAACDRRFVAMMERGALAEVDALLARDLDPTLPAMKILGVRELAAYRRGALSRDEAVAKAQQATRNYAKRQMTWFNNQWGKDGVNGRGA